MHLVNLSSMNGGYPIFGLEQRLSMMNDNTDRIGSPLRDSSSVLIFPSTFKLADRELLKLV
ncbi:MAG TPA: hypothetical protein DD761_08630 [Cyanobacteria bacterium UBA11691]|nr:hypothetical protein [Cyanobacteria bacterium UBA11691]